MFSTYKKIFILPLLSVLLLAGCSKLVEIDPPLNELSSELVFTSDATAKAALAGLYSNLSQSTNQSSGMTMYNALASDEFEYLGASVAYDDIRNNNLLPTSSSSSSFFSELYTSIYRANSIIEGLQLYTGTSAAVRKQMMGEAKFIRAYCYFYLVNLFGKVPLILTTDVTQTALLPRTGTDTVYNQMRVDLLAARDSLLTDYSASSGNRSNANRYAALALLARVYLYTGQYALAAATADEVIKATTLYTLIPKATMATGVFVKNSQESIFQFLPYLASTNSYTNEGSTFVTTTAAFSLRNTYLTAFDSGDVRRAKWVNDVTFTGVVNHQPFKYKYRTNALAVTAGVVETPVVLRLAEQYLIRAEARAHNGNLDSALADVNAIRNRAGVTPRLATTDVNILLDYIEKERQCELFCEWGHRWFDLKRTGRSTAVIGAIKSTWNATDTLYPLPQTAIDANPNLGQNDGYK